MSRFLKPVHRRVTDHLMRRSAVAANAYILAVCAAGMTAVADNAVQMRLGASQLTLNAVFMAIGMVVGELFPLRVRRPGAEGEVTPSTTFTFALVLAAGTAAIPLVAVSSMVCDRITGKAPLKIIFNASQYALTMLAACAVLSSLTGVPHLHEPLPFHPDELPAIMLAAAVFFVVNSLLVATVVALLEQMSVLRCLFDDLLFQVTSAGLLLGLTPMVVVSTSFSPLLLPLFVLPLLSIVQGQRQALQKEHEALHDPLTGLPNRVLFGQRVQTAARSAAKDGEQTAVMLIDLDGFKEINDTLGHHEGDRLLIAMAHRLRAGLRGDDVVARLGGDEFGVLLPTATRAQAAAVAEKLHALIREPIEFDHIELEIGGSIGIALYPDHGTDVEMLLQHADVGMYRAKRARLGLEFYDPQESTAVGRSALAAEMSSGLDSGEFVPYFQPKVELVSGRVVGVEALMRWRHPSRGVLLPNDFVPVAEQSGLIVRATEAMIEGTLRQRAAFAEHGYELTVAVNLSPRELLDRRLSARIAALLERTGTPPHVLELEITEGMLMADPERSARVLQTLRDMGVSIALDDFGTGYSSLERLRHLPVDTVKIDRSFVTGMTADGSAAVIVQSTVDLAHHLGLQVVAEGVEDAATMARLSAGGCDVAQGYLFSRPLPAAELSAWLAARHRPALAARAS